MGHKAASLFAVAEKSGGLAGKIRLATLARVTSTEASASADEPELIARLEQALARLNDEASGGFASPPPTASSLVQGVGTSTQTLSMPAHIKLLQQQMDLLVDLLAQRALFLSDAAATARRVTEAAARGLGTARASVWMLDIPSGAKISCVDLFVAGTSTHAAGLELFQRDFAPYFTALATERTIAAHDANTDPRTSCFSTTYLRPLGITSMLDVPINASGKMVGVLCCEHIGMPRHWTHDDERFGYLLANLMAVALERGR